MEVEVMMLREWEKKREPIICGATLVGGPKLPENYQNQVERPKLNGLRIKMTNLQGFISLGVKIRKTQQLEKQMSSIQIAIMDI